MAKQLPPSDLVALCRDLARLTHGRCPLERPEALRRAHWQLRCYAEEHELPEEWCDSTLLLFLDPY